MSRIQILSLAILIIVLPCEVFGAPEYVEILPPNPSVNDAVSLKTTLLWATSGYEVTEASVKFRSAYELQIDLTVSYPGPGEILLMVTTDGVHTAELGPLPAGTYSYTVTETGLQRTTNLPVSGGSVSGSFSVVPEPSFATLALVASLVLSGLKKVASSKSYRPKNVTRSEVIFIATGRS